MYNFTCTPKVITSYLLSIAGILLTANFFVIHRNLVAPEPVLRGYRAAFYFGADANLPSLFVALLVLSCALLFWKTSTLSSALSRERSTFKMLAAFFLLLMIEVFFKPHLLLFAAIEAVLKPAIPGYLPVIWFLMAAVFFLSVSFIILAAVLFLPDELKGSFITAALLFMIGVIVNFSVQPRTGTYASYTKVVTALGETLSVLLQMIAVLQLLHTLAGFYLSYVKKPAIRLSFFASQGEQQGDHQLEDQLTEII